MEDCNNSNLCKYQANCGWCTTQQTDQHTHKKVGNPVPALRQAWPGLGHLGWTHSRTRQSPCCCWAHLLECHRRATASDAWELQSVWLLVRTPTLIAPHPPPQTLWPHSGTWKEKESRAREPGDGQGWHFAWPPRTAFGTRSSSGYREGCRIIRRQLCFRPAPSSCMCCLHTRPPSLQVDAVTLITFIQFRYGSFSSTKE